MPTEEYSGDTQESKKGCSLKGCLPIFIIMVVIVFLIVPLFRQFYNSDRKDEYLNKSTPAETTDGELEKSSAQEDVIEQTPMIQEVKETPTFEETADLPEDIQKVLLSEEIEVLEYSWIYSGKEWAWELRIPRAAYDTYRLILRPLTMDYSVYVTHPFDDTYIDSLVDSIREAAALEGYSEYQIVEFTTSFVQSLEYTEDSVTSSYDEYPRYPIETLFDKGGDCEDTSILLASLLHSMGYGVVIIELPGHCAVGILGGENMYGSYWEYKGGKYYYVETTNTGWGIGQLPDVYKESSAHIYPMLPIPVISHEWTFKSKILWGELTVIVTNSGTATAADVYVLAGFDAGNSQIWSPARSSVYDLEAGMQLTTTMNLSPPPSGIRTRLVVQIVMGEYCISESYSEWFDT